MKLNIVPPRTGFLWVRLGVRVFLRQPLALSVLFFLCMACMTLATLIPLAGTVLALVMLPTVTLVMMAGAAEAHLGKRPLPTLLLVAFRTGRERARAMAVLGLLYAAGFLLVIALSALVDGGEFASVYLGTKAPTQEMVESASFQGAMWLAMLLYIPLSLLFWHAPGLVHWHAVPPVTALSFTTVACWRNLGAFMLYELGWLGVFMALGIVVSLVVAMLSMAGLGLGAATSLMLVTAIALAAMFFSSVVFTFRDCFEAPAAEPVHEPAA